MWLRPYQASDAKVILGWIRDERAFRKWSADRYDSYPIDPEDINRLYSSADGMAFFPMTAEDESGVVGHLIMRYPNAGRKTVRFGFIIVDAAKRGRGYGKQMLALAIAYAFDILKVQKITLGVFENNPAAYYCYKSVGFQDVLMEKYEYYHVMGQNWKCLELELTRNDK